MAIAAPPSPSPAALAEEIRSGERELRRVLPNASPELQLLALQALDLTRTLLDPNLVAVLSAPESQKDPKSLETYAAWMRFAEAYKPILERMLAIAKKGSPPPTSS